MHWSDRASLDFLRTFARRIDHRQVLLLTTYRADELQRHHPLYVLLPFLARETQAIRVELRPLDADGQRALIEERYKLTAPDRLRLETYLDEHAEGNPLFAGELLRTLEAEEILSRQGKTWSLGDLRSGAVPALLRQVIDARLAHLTEDVRLLLQVATVVGQEVPLTLWQNVSGADDEVIAAAIEQGKSAHLILDDSRGNFRFRHALFREVVYDDITALRRRHLHTAAAEALLSLTEPDPDVIAYHFQRAADARAIGWLIRAGERAQRSYAWLQAADRFDAAQRLLESDAPRARERAWLLYRIARLKRFANPSDGIAYLETAERLARQLGDRVLAAHALAARGVLRCYAGDDRQGLVEMEAGDAALEQLATEHVELDEFSQHWAVDAIASGRLPVSRTTQVMTNTRRGTFATRLAMVGRVREGRELAQRHIAAFEQLHDLDAAMIESHADAHLALASYYQATGETNTARAMFARFREISQQIDHRQMIGASALYELNGIMIPFKTDDVRAQSELVRLAEDAFRTASGAESGGSVLNSGQVWHMLLHGEWQIAHATAIAESEWNVKEGTHLWVNLTLGLLARFRGDRQTAWQEVFKVFPNGPDTEPGATYFPAAVEIQHLAAALALDANDLPAAREWIEMLDRWLAWSDCIPGRAEAALLWAKYHLADEHAPLASQEAERALAHASDPRQPLALIAAHRFLGSLDTVDEHFASAEQHLQESLQLAEACAAPFERALALLEVAKLRLVQGQIQEATALLDEVQSVCEPLGARPTLERVASLREQIDQNSKKPARYPAGLSPREVEVLKLVAEGLTDAEIAEQLFISRRTVTSHITNIFNKLGVNARAAAVAAAARTGIL